APCTSFLFPHVFYSSDRNKHTGGAEFLAEDVRSLFRVVVSSPHQTLDQIRDFPAAGNGLPVVDGFLQSSRTFPVRQWKHTRSSFPDTPENELARSEAGPCSILRNCDGNTSP